MLVSINIFILLPAIVIGLIYGIDFRTVFDVNQELMLIEVYVFKRLRVARLRARVYADHIYVKFLTTPYRKLSWLIKRFDKNSTKSNIVSQSADKKGVSQADIITPIRVKSLRINMIVGTDDAFLTSFIWSGAGMLLGVLDEVVSNRLKIKKYRTQFKPNYYGNEFAMDVALSISFREIMRIVSVMKGKKKVRAKCRKTK